MDISVSVFACPRHDVAGNMYIFNHNFVDSIHFDFMDGKCVPLKGVELSDLFYLADNVDLPFDVHLMIENQTGFYETIRGIRNLRNIILTIENEDADTLVGLLKEIRSDNLSPVVAIWPETPLQMLSAFSDLIDGILIMTTEAGVPNSVFIEDSISRVAEIVSAYRLKRMKFIVDGGMTSSRLVEVNKLGVSTGVVGRSFFDHDERIRIEKLR